MRVTCTSLQMTMRGVPHQRSPSLSFLFSPFLCKARAVLTSLSIPQPFLSLTFTEIESHGMYFPCLASFSQTQPGDSASWQHRPVACSLRSPTMRLFISLLMGTWAAPSLGLVLLWIFLSVLLGIDMHLSPLDTPRSGTARSRGGCILG